MGNLSLRDYNRIIDLTMMSLDRVSSGESETPWQSICEGLAGSIAGSAASGIFSVQWPSGATVGVTWPSSAMQFPAWAVAMHMRTHPLTEHVLRGGTSPVTIGDLVDGRTWRNSATYSELRSYLGVSRQLAVPLPGVPGSLRFLSVSRDGRDYSDRDRAFALRLQPLLIQIDRLTMELRRLRQALPASMRSDLEPRISACSITPRELTVLALLAQGLTAAAIGRRLAISEHTVVKHKDNLYRKLRVSDRVTAVLEAQRQGLLPQTATVNP
ncbi:LuxR C-terminal-related transcriptional regulator [Actinoplanes sp. NPDC049118]|uniref:helix-turn-helix transcriptional regulator n=1 Tax=Actinoplanes sp. NPDC049118 TaxID=3155769 RepID=UPI00340976B8